MSPAPVPTAPRVLLLDSGRVWRGTQRQLFLLAEGLRERGVEPLVVAPPRSPLLAACKRAGIATAARAMTSAIDLLAVRALRRLIATWRPTVVHAHCPRTHLLALAALLGKRRAIPLVVTRRLASAPRGRLRHGDRVARFIAITDAGAAALRAGGVPPDRVARIYPGVRTRLDGPARDWRAECGWAPETVVAGLVGPLTESAHRDGLARLLRALPPATRARLGVVLLGGPGSGRGDEGGCRIYRAGFVHEITTALAGLDLLLHPGESRGMGTALVEGLALRVPAIAFDSGGVGEILVDGSSGVLVPLGDTTGFAQAVAALVDDPERRRALGNAGPARADSFGVPAMVEQTLALYRDVTPLTAGSGTSG